MSSAEAQSVCTRIEQACYRDFDPAALTIGETAAIADEMHALGNVSYANVIIRNLHPEVEQAVASEGKLDVVRKQLTGATAAAHRHLHTIENQIMGTSTNVEMPYCCTTGCVRTITRLLTDAACDLQVERRGDQRLSVISFRRVEDLIRSSRFHDHTILHHDDVIGQGSDHL